jgi:hypothetical protein
MSKKLKKVLKPLIEECIKEMIFEDGVLSSIIREAQGSPAKQVVKEEKPFAKFVKESRTENKQLNETRNKMRKAISEKLGDFDPFEGTQALTESQASGKPSQSPMAGVDPSDKGIDLTNIPGAGRWAAINERLTDG